MSQIFGIVERMIIIAHIKYLVTNSIQIFIMFITTAVMVVLCLSNFIEAYSMVDQPADQMSNSYVEFSILTNQVDYETNNNINTLKELINFINNDSKSYLFFKENDLTNGKAVYFRNMDFSPKLIDGRSFNETDFKNHTNTILISKDVLDQTFEKNGKTYYIVENNAYEVIGVYEKSSNKINVDSDYYLNMLSANNLQVHENMIAGLYQLDAANQTDQIVKNLSMVLPIEINDKSKSNSFLDKMQKTLSTQAISVFPILLVALMVLLNTISITSNWIGRRKKEIAIRWLCGATKEDIKRLLFFEYIIITTLCFLIGFILAYIISRVNMWIFIGFDFSLTTILIAYFITLTIGIASSFILLKQYDSYEINRLMR